MLSYLACQLYVLFREKISIFKNIKKKVLQNKQENVRTFWRANTIEIEIIKWNYNFFSYLYFLDIYSVSFYIWISGQINFLCYILFHFVDGIMFRILSFYPFFLDNLFCADYELHY